jgi:hypothetical protein
MSAAKRHRLEIATFQRCPPGGMTRGWVACAVGDEIWPNIQILREKGVTLVEAHPHAALCPPDPSIVDEVEEFVLRCVCGKGLGP